MGTRRPIREFFRSRAAGQSSPTGMRSQGATPKPELYILLALICSCVSKLMCRVSSKASAKIIEWSSPESAKAGPGGALLPFPLPM
ncbi:hypothetical protein D3C78_1601640 [compost metagenome]